MSKFKLTQEQIDKYAEALDIGYSYEHVFNEIAELAISAPAETGVAEEILMNCCIEAMPSRESEIREAFDKDRSYQEDDDLFFTKIIESFSKAMTTYAAQRCAEKDREIERLKEFEFMYNGLNK